VQSESIATVRTAAPDASDVTATDSKEERRARRRAEKEARKNANATGGEPAADETRIAVNESQEKLLQKAKKAMKTSKKVASRTTTEDAAQVDDSAAPQEASSSRPRSPSPLVPKGALPAFPLPTGPAKPDAMLLSAQGLPTALKDAVLIDENLKTAVNELTLRPSRKGKERAHEGLDDPLKKKLAEAGVDEFFAGKSRCSFRFHCSYQCLTFISRHSAIRSSAGSPRPTPCTRSQHLPSRLPRVCAHWIRKDAVLCHSAGPGALCCPFAVWYAG
jgi:hypothetical protein